MPLMPHSQLSDNSSNHTGRSSAVSMRKRLNHGNCQNHGEIFNKNDKSQKKSNHGAHKEHRGLKEVGLEFFHASSGVENL
jgi:hypothetical protein